MFDYKTYFKHYPKNQSQEHYALTQLAKLILNSRGYTIIGLEVEMYGCAVNNNKTNKQIIDAAAVRTLSSGQIDFMINHKTENLNSQQLTGFGIEVKVSRSDFRNGYYCNLPYNAILCPKDMIKPNEVPGKIGLIYIDLNNIDNINSKFWIVAKKSRLDIDNKYKIKNQIGRIYTKSYYDHLSHLFYNIAKKEFL